VKAFLTRPIEGDWPYPWIDATYVKVRQNGRIVSVAVIVAVGVKIDGRREVLGLDIGPSEAETFLDRVPAQARPPRAARGQAGDLGCPRGDQGGGRQGAQHLAALREAMWTISPVAILACRHALTVRLKIPAVGRGSLTIG
jgi:hypothetical protein